MTVINNMALIQVLQGLSIHCYCSSGLTLCKGIQPKLSRHFGWPFSVPHSVMAKIHHPSMLVLYPSYGYSLNGISHCSFPYHPQSFIPIITLWMQLRLGPHTPLIVCNIWYRVLQIIYVLQVVSLVDVHTFCRRHVHASSEYMHVEPSASQMLLRNQELQPRQMQAVEAYHCHC